jgi:hypothetical protein
LNLARPFQAGEDEQQRLGVALATRGCGLKRRSRDGNLKRIMIPALKGRAKIRLSLRDENHTIKHL